MQNAPFLSPVAPETKLPALSGILSLHHQSRQRRGDQSTQPTSSYNRIIAVKEDGLFLIDPDKTHGKTFLSGYDQGLGAGPFSTKDASRKTQSAQVGEVVFLASATGPATEHPEAVLAIQDDYVIPLLLPEVPAIDITFESVKTDGDTEKEYPLLSAGVYGIRFAWVLHDGTIGPATAPYLMSVGNVSAGEWLFKLNFSVSDVSGLADFWQFVVRGIVIFVTPRSDVINPDETESESDATLAGQGPAFSLMNLPYYQVAEIPTPASAINDWLSNVSEWVTTWGDRSDNIPASYLSLTDDRLRIAAAGCAFSYNRRLLLGDVAIDYAKPRIDSFLSDPADAVPTAPDVQDIGPQTGTVDLVTAIYVEMLNAIGINFSEVEVRVQFPAGSGDGFLVIHEVWNGAVWLPDKTIIDQGDGDWQGTAPFNENSHRRRVKFEFQEDGPTGAGLAIQVDVKATNIHGLSDQETFQLTIT